MNFTFTWIMDKLGYMPKFDMEIGKLVEESFPVKSEKTKKAVKKVAAKKVAAKKSVARKK